MTVFVIVTAAVRAIALPLIVVTTAVGGLPPVVDIVIDALANMVYYPTPTAPVNLDGINAPVGSLVFGCATTSPWRQKMRLGSVSRVDQAIAPGAGLEDV